MGPGPLSKGKFCCNRLDWAKSVINKFNDQTQKWLKEARKYIDEDNYILSSTRMLMIMVNAGSTTLGLGPTGNGLDRKK